MDPTALRSELLELRDRWLRLAVLYGLARTLLVAAAAIVALFLLDRFLVLPPQMRLVLAATAVFAVGYAIFRGVVYPLRRAPDAHDVAAAIERRFPAFDGQLIAALELEGEALDPSRNVSLELVSQLRDQVASLRQGLRLADIFEPRPLRNQAALAGLLLAVVAGYGALRPDLVAIFLDRALGGDTRWPQRTQLHVEFAAAASHFEVERDGDRPIGVRIARGASLPVTVRVVGEDPDAVVLVTEGDGRGDVTLTATAPREWVGRFRAVRDSFRFRPIGGDDDGEGREVEVQVFAPPAVAGIATTLEFPAYTGLEPRREPRGDVEAPVGTRVEVEVECAEAIASARLLFDGKDEIALVAIPEIGDAGDAGASKAPRGARLRAEFVVAESGSYSIELEGESGFRNLEPPTYAIVARKDRPPSVRVLEPARGDVDVTPKGIVPLLVVADDDYGISLLDVDIRPFGAEQGRIVELRAPSDADVKRRVVYETFDFSRERFGEGEAAREVAAGETLVYRVRARDNFVAADGTFAANETMLAERRIDVVSPSEMLRLLTERQIRTKDEIRNLLAVQREKRERLDATLRAAEGDDGGSFEPSDLAAIEVGQNQVSTRALRQCREFADIFQDYLVNRLDESAGAESLLLVVLDARRTSLVLDGFDSRSYATILERHESGAFGRLDVLGRLLAMLRCAVDVAERHSPAAATALSEARVAIDDAARPPLLRRALEAQDAAILQLEALLEKLDEWENYQEILALFRSVVDDQRDLNARTRRALRPGGADEEEER
jgi:hypothetical protein